MLKTHQHPPFKSQMKPGQSVTVFHNLKYKHYTTSIFTRFFGHTNFNIVGNTDLAIKTVFIIYFFLFNVFLRMSWGGINFVQIFRQVFKTHFKNVVPNKPLLIDDHAFWQWRKKSRVCFFFLR